GDHLVELERAGQVQVDVARHVEAEAVRSHHAAEYRLFAQDDVGAGQLDVRSGGHDAYHDRRAALARHAHGLADRRRKTDRLERVVHTAARHVDDLHDGIAGGRVHDVRRAEAARQIELPGGG